MSYYLVVHSREGATISSLHVTMHTTRAAADDAVKNFDVAQWCAGLDPDPNFPPTPFIFEINKNDTLAKLVWFCGEEQLEGHDSITSLLRERDPATLGRVIAELQSRKEALAAANQSEG